METQSQSTVKAPPSTPRGNSGQAIVAPKESGPGSSDVFRYRPAGDELEHDQDYSSAHGDSEFDLSALTPTQREEFRKSGKLPDKAKVAPKQEMEPVALDPSKWSKKEYKHWRKTGEAPEWALQGKSDPDQERTAESTTEQEQQTAGIESGKPNERVWTQQLKPEEKQKYEQARASHINEGFQKVAQHPQAKQINEGLELLTNSLKGTNDAGREIFFRALNEVPNPGEVLAQLGLNKDDCRQLLRSPDVKTLRDSIQKISRVLIQREKPARQKITSAPGCGCGSGREWKWKGKVKIVRR